MIKKILVLSFLLCVVIASSSLAGVITSGAKQHLYGTSDGVAVTVKYLGNSTYGGSVTFATAGTGCTFYAVGAVDTDIGASGVLTWGGVDDSDTIHTVVGFKDAVEKGNWKVTIVDAMDVDSPSLIFDTSTMTTVGNNANIYLSGIFTAASEATGNDTRCYDQIRVNCRSGEFIRMWYANSVATGGTIRIYNAKTGTELWRSATSATASIDFTPEGQDFSHDIVVRYRETSDLVFSTNEYLQMRYAIMSVDSKQ